MVILTGLGLSRVNYVLLMCLATREREQRGYCPSRGHATATPCVHVCPFFFEPGMRSCALGKIYDLLSFPASGLALDSRLLFGWAQWI